MASVGMKLKLGPWPNWTRIGLLIVAVLKVLWEPSHVSAAETNPLLSTWLASQTNLHSWSADVLQIRTLKTLAQPLTARGRVWFVAPNLFRWELGEPAQAIAVRQPSEMLVIYPRLKRVERYPLDAGKAGPWRDALSLLEAGFPRNQADLESRFKLLSVTGSGDSARATLQPKSATARRMMPEITIIFDVKNGSLRGTELTFADGSRMRNEFTNTALNPKIDDALFHPQWPPEFKIVQPLGDLGK